MQEKMAAHLAMLDGTRRAQGMDAGEARYAALRAARSGPVEVLRAE
jgi:hypothetical protein